jgi:hypothetical protein
MSWCTDTPEDEAISLFAGLLANPDVPLSRHLLPSNRHGFRNRLKIKVSLIVVNNIIVKKLSLKVSPIAVNVIDYHFHLLQ